MKQFHQIRCKFPFICDVTNDSVCLTLKLVIADPYMATTENLKDYHAHGIYPGVLESCCPTPASNLQP